MLGLGSRGKDWLFSRADLENSASRRDGYGVVDENNRRARSISFLYEVARVLEVRIYVASTAAIYFHRFFLFHSLQQHDRLLTASVCLFLACKNEDMFKKLERVIAAFVFVRSKGMGITDDGKQLQKEFSEYYETETKRIKDEVAQLKEKFLQLEKLILMTLCFELHIFHPHQVVSNHLKKMNSECLYE